MAAASSADPRMGADGYAKCYLREAYSTEAVIRAVNMNIDEGRIPLPGMYTVRPCEPREKQGDHLNPIVGNAQITKADWGPHNFEYGVTDMQPLPHSGRKKRKVPCIRSIQFTYIENLPASGGAVHVALLFYDWNCGIVVVWSVLPDCSIREPTSLGGLRHI